MGDDDGGGPGGGGRGGGGDGSRPPDCGGASPPAPHDQLSHASPATAAADAEHHHHADAERRRGRRAGVGAKRVAVILARWSDAPGPTATAAGNFEVQYNGDTAHWFDWASYGQLELATTFFNVAAPPTERGPADGECRGRAESMGSVAATDAGNDVWATTPGFSRGDYRAVVWLVLAQECSGPGGTGGGLISLTEVDYNAAGWATSPPEARDCGPGQGLACNAVYLHEMLHALGLGYHRNAIECGPDAGPAAWRDCPDVEYGDHFDMLGSSSGKQCPGLGAGPRQALGWLSGAGDTVGATESTTGVAIGSLTAGNAPSPL